jgi:hypothetical protein
MLMRALRGWAITSTSSMQSKPLIRQRPGSSPSAAQLWWPSQTTCKRATLTREGSNPPSADVQSVWFKVGGERPLIVWKVAPSPNPGQHGQIAPTADVARTGNGQASGPVYAVLESPIRSRTRVASSSIGKGLVIMAIPGSRKPLASAAFSA